MEQTKGGCTLLDFSGSLAAVELVIMGIRTARPPNLPLHLRGYRSRQAGRQVDSWAGQAGRSDRSGRRTDEQGGRDSATRSGQPRQAQDFAWSCRPALRTRPGWRAERHSRTDWRGQGRLASKGRLLRKGGRGAWGQGRSGGRTRGKGVEGRLGSKEREGKTEAGVPSATSRRCATRPGVV